MFRAVCARLHLLAPTIGLLVSTACTAGVADAPALGTAVGGDAVGADTILGDTTASADTLGDDASAQDGTVAGDAPLSDGTGPSDGTATGDGTVVTDGSGGDATTTDAKPAKYNTCTDLLQCTQFACGGEPQMGCQTLCTDVASAPAKQALQPIIDCMQDVCMNALCKNSSDPKCVGKCTYEKCIGKILSCVGEGKVGGGSCDAILGCFDSCKGASSWGCLASCYGSTDANAQADFQAYADCAAAAAAKGQAADKVCTAQWLECLSGGKSGPGGCTDTLGCWFDCNAGAGGDGVKLKCMADCYGKASADGKKLFLEVAKCFDSSDPACPGTFVTCANPTGTATCLKTLGCVGACQGGDGAKFKCAMGCLHDASPAEATAAVTYGNCVDTKCKACAEESVCKDKCSKEQCGAEFNKCLGG